MNFLAPRQGLFAVIIIISLCLHTLFFVLSEERESKEHQHMVATQAVSELVQALKIPMATDDRISMSVIADKYIKEEKLAFVGVYDAEDALLVPMGKESAGGLSLKESVVLGSNALGSVVVKMDAVNHAQIISRHWLFLLAVTGLHAILWLIYGYLARPTVQMQTMIAQKVRLELLDKGLLQQVPLTTVQSPDEADDQNDSVLQPLPTSSPNHSESQNAHAKTDVDESTPITDNEKLVVQVLFEDPHELFSTVSNDNKVAYFALCDQLLNKALLHLLELPLLAGVQANVVKGYDEKGAKVALYGNTTAKVATAAVFLSKLMMMLNQVVYEKHREIKRVAWQVRTTVSHASDAGIMLDLSKRRREAPMILLDKVARDEVKSYVQLTHLDAPMSVQEREACSLTNITSGAADRLRSVQDKVLLED
ncbi:hypothetical protein M2R47_01725 [Moraxella sp. Tifton1]|uniref:hypothetical protein n=1 Tax=Moraxella oculi TaxID=2940516 RepID=UPI002012A420|nr:hypothetical protein [Moraxella sp. Tifton1]MCL1622974.1 hypothetical protein [Moraxella sp. Tifton1]